MPRRTTTGSKGFIWIPPQFTANYSLTVTRTNGVVDDLTDIAHLVEIEEGITNQIGRFAFEVYDLNDLYKNVWSGGELVRFSSDYASTVSTLRFTGKIEKIAPNGIKLRVTGRNYAQDLIDITVTQSFTDEETSIILSTLFDIYANGFTKTDIEVSTKRLTLSWKQKPFLECVKEIALAAGFDFYIDQDKDVNYFRVGNRTNDDEAIVHEQNLIEVKDFAEDLTLVRNRVIVYGAVQDGIQVIYTAEDLDSQAKYGIKEEVINDNNILSYEQAREVGDATLSAKKNPPLIGEVVGVLLATLQPGERIKLSSPFHGIQPGTYDIISYKHTISGNEYSTRVKVSKEPRTTTHIFEAIIGSLSRSKETGLNPFEMRQAYNFTFDSNSGIHTGTEITNGVLRITTGNDSGNWVSPTRNSASTITQAYLILVGETLNGAIVEASADDGGTYNIISNKQRINFTSSGTKLRIKVSLSNPDTQIDSLSIQYK